MKSETQNVTIRRAKPSDGDAFIRLVIGLADYESLPPPDAAGQQRLLEDAFGQRKRFDLLLAEVGGQAVGYAVIFETYSTFLARPKLYLEDLFVNPKFRGCGAGLALFNACAQEAVQRGCARMQWTVLDWNDPAISFYQRLGAQHEKTWHTYSLDEEQLRQLPSPAITS
ncbi:MAG: GNAT family N-acetyltransferase [Acidobacteriota bacterium]